MKYYNTFVVKFTRTMRWLHKFCYHTGFYRVPLYLEVSSKRKQQLTINNVNN